MSVSELERPGVPRPKFDWTINLGHILTLAVILVGMATAYSTYKLTINDHDARLRALEKQGIVLDARTNEIYRTLYDIKQDLAIVKYRLEQDTKK